MQPPRHVILVDRPAAAAHDERDRAAGELVAHYLEERGIDCRLGTTGEDDNVVLVLVRARGSSADFGLRSSTEGDDSRWVDEAPDEQLLSPRFTTCFKVEVRSPSDIHVDGFGVLVTAVVGTRGERDGIMRALGFPTRPGDLLRRCIGGERRPKAFPPDALDLAGECVAGRVSLAQAAKAESARVPVANGWLGLRVTEHPSG